MRDWIKLGVGPTQFRLFGFQRSYAVVDQSYAVVDQSGRPPLSPDWETYELGIHDEWFHLPDRRPRNTKEQAKQLAQAHLFFREHSVTKEHSPNCPVCGAKITNRVVDRLDGTITIIMNATESCLECRLYDHVFTPGVLRQRLGFVWIERSYKHEPKEYDALTERWLAARDEAQTLLRLMRETDRWWTDSLLEAEANRDEGPFQAFADFCQESGLPIHEEESRVRGRTAAV